VKSNEKPLLAQIGKMTTGRKNALSSTSIFAHSAVEKVNEQENPAGYAEFTGMGKKI
jgi:hypothetical protein